MNCDRIAPYYALMERLSFGSLLASLRRRYLNELGSARHVLVLGGGDGRALKDLLAACPRAQVDYVDCSRRMLELARRRAGSARVKYYLADALEWPMLQDYYDAVVTHFFLDCFTAPELDRLSRRLSVSAKPDANWVISEFRIPHTWLASAARGLIGLMYCFFGLLTGLKTNRLEDHREFLIRAGFRLISCESTLCGILAAEFWKRDGASVY